MEERRAMTHHENPSPEDFAIATMYRLDPERLAQIRRIISGMTRCPECDALNRADQKYCDTCGAKLYSEVEDKKKEGEDEPYVSPDRQRILEEMSSDQASVPATTDHIDPKQPAEVEPVPNGMRRCPECDALNKSDQRYCGYCGAEFYPEVKAAAHVLPKKRENRNRTEGLDSESPPYY